MPEPTSTFSFLFGIGSYAYGTSLETVDDMPMLKTVSGEISGMHGSYHGDTYVSERRLELGGKIIGDTQEDTRDRWDEFVRHHQSGRIQRVILQGNRWVWGSVEGNITRKITNFRRVEWSLIIYCGDPFAYQNTLESTTIPSCAATTPTVVSAGHTFTADGNATAEPYWVFTVSAVVTPGTSYVELYNQGWIDETGKEQSFKFYPRVTGDYIVYFGRNTTASEVVNRQRRHKVYSATDPLVNKYRRGSEISLLPGDNNLIIKCSGASVSASTLSWYPRFIS